MLFIIIHQVFHSHKLKISFDTKFQTYELWFKQILHELDEVVHLLNRDYVPGSYSISVFLSNSWCHSIWELQSKISSGISDSPFFRARCCENCPPLKQDRRSPKGRSRKSYFRYAQTRTGPPQSTRRTQDDDSVGFPWLSVWFRCRLRSVAISCIRPLGSKATNSDCWRTSLDYNPKNGFNTRGAIMRWSEWSELLITQNYLLSTKNKW